MDFMVQDMQLFFSNIILYNGSATPFGQLGERVRRVFERKWAASPFGPSTRTRRATAGASATVVERPSPDQCVSPFLPCLIYEGASALCPTDDLRCQKNNHAKDISAGSLIDISCLPEVYPNKRQLGRSFFRDVSSSGLVPLRLSRLCFFDALYYLFS